MQVVPQLLPANHVARGLESRPPKLPNPLNPNGKSRSKPTRTLRATQLAPLNCPGLLALVHLRLLIHLPTPLYLLALHHYLLPARLRLLVLVHLRLLAVHLRLLTLRYLLALRLHQLALHPSQLPLRLTCFLRVYVSACWFYYISACWLFISDFARIIRCGINSICTDSTSYDAKRKLAQWPVTGARSCVT